MTPSFLNGPAKPGRPRRGEVHVWRLLLPPTDGDMALCRNSLSEDEVRRMQAYRFERDQRRFAACRGTLRRLLGAYLGVEPAAVALAEEPGGRPVLAEPALAEDLRFNVSHAEDLALLAFASGMDVGVDVEPLARELDHLQIARQFFSREDQDAIAAVPEAERRRAFLLRWVCKEAALKALGAGLTVSPDRVRLEFGGKRPTAAIDSAVLPLAVFEPLEGHVAALACVNMGSEAPSLRYWQVEKW